MNNPEPLPDAVPHSQSGTHLLLTVAVLAGIGAVAYADALVITISLGYLYVLPLSLSALIHRLRTTMVLVAGCVALHDWLGPFEHTGTIHIWSNVLTLIGFTTAVLFVNRLAQRQRALVDIIRHQRDELAGEIRLAAEVQQRLLPRQMPESTHFEFAATMEAAKAVGGDYYDCIPLPGGDFGLAIADVSGKGVAAALLMASVQMATRSNAPHAKTCSRLVEQINKYLFSITTMDRYVTFFYARIRPQPAGLSFCNAGHLAPLLVRGKTGECEWLEEGGPVLGLLPDAPYGDGERPLTTGDVLVLFTDGVSETADAVGLEFSPQGVKEVVQKHRGESAARILAALREAVARFSLSAPLLDDLTIMVIKVIA